ncbi:LysR family transcriptional regulator [Limosilactobacillus reuteri]|uniref:LysR family transcriptional regulator n=1 Tax=Limosilactobacillus reuteri TaxID=1598 RepID=UPI001E2E5FBB|nr:LysR family transcriptional regulator [Limosilactobacillus reuteri]MCC4380925.1 LysR family transcriptional regulator [Limosilactobacillus reuteri]
METRILTYFLKIAELSNMSKAAEELHITQPTLSRQIKTLEDSLGVKLFQRGNRSMTLTSAGIIFQKRAQRIVELVNKAEQDISDQTELNGVISIGCIESTVSNFLGSMITSFHNKYPKVRFNLYDADGSDIHEKLDRGTIDLGFLMTPVEVAKYNSIKLPVTDQWCLAVPKDHPIAQQTKIATNDLRSLPLIIPTRKIVQGEIFSWLHIPANELNIISTQNLVSDSLFLIKAQIAFAICIAGAFYDRPDPDLTLVPIDTDTVVNHVMVWRKNYTLSRSAITFIEFIKEQVDDPNSLWQLYSKASK